MHEAPQRAGRTHQDQDDRERCTPAGGDPGEELRDGQPGGREGEGGSNPGEEGSFIGEAEPIVGPASYPPDRARISHRLPKKVAVVAASDPAQRTTQRRQWTHVRNGSARPLRKWAAAAPRPLSRELS